MSSAFHACACSTLPVPFAAPHARRATRKCWALVGADHEPCSGSLQVTRLQLPVI